MRKSVLAKSLMQNKNHDYGEAWRDMRVSSLTDLILQKLLRVKQIEDNDGQTLVSEGLVGKLSGHDQLCEFLRSHSLRRIHEFFKKNHLQS